MSVDRGEIFKNRAAKSLAVKFIFPRYEMNHDNEIHRLRAFRARHNIT